VIRQFSWGIEAILLGLLASGVATVVRAGRDGRDRK